MDRTINLELTRGELGILLRHVKMDKKSDEIAMKFIDVVAPEVCGEIKEVLELKNRALVTLIARIKDKANEVGCREKIKEYDQLLDQHMKSKIFSDTIQKHCEILFKEFITFDENIEAALVAPSERDAHVKFFNLVQRIIK